MFPIWYWMITLFPNHYGMRWVFLFSSQCHLIFLVLLIFIFLLGIVELLISALVYRGVFMAV